MASSWIDSLKQQLKKKNFTIV